MTLPTNSTNKELGWLESEKYLGRRFRADTFGHFQTPVYFLGPLGWQMVGMPMENYKEYRLGILRRAERQLEHRLWVHEVLLKFLLETRVTRIIDGEDGFWQEGIEFGNIPDAWIQFDGGEVFIEVDLDTEHPLIMKKKFEKYMRFAESGGYGRLLPGCAFRVLVFTTTEKRVESLEGMTGSDEIWFCTMKEFVKEDLDHQHWFALNGFYALSASKQKEV